jgi:hypothetical protein
MKWLSLLHLLGLVCRYDEYNLQPDQVHRNSIILKNSLLTVNKTSAEAWILLHKKVSAVTASST